MRSVPIAATRPTLFAQCLHRTNAKVTEKHTDEDLSDAASSTGKEVFGSLESSTALALELHLGISSSVGHGCAGLCCFVEWLVREVRCSRWRHLTTYFVGTDKSLGGVPPFLFFFPSFFFRLYFLFSPFPCYPLKQLTKNETPVWHVRCN